MLIRWEAAAEKWISFVDSQVSEVLLPRRVFETDRAVIE